MLERMLERRAGQVLELMSEREPGQALALMSERRAVQAMVVLLGLRLRLGFRRLYRCHLPGQVVTPGPNATRASKAANEVMKTLIRHSSSA